MASNDLALLRLFIDDPDNEDRVFDDPTLDLLVLQADGDMFAAASLAWSIKAANVADWFMSQVDGALLNRDQVFQHCRDMAEYYEGRSSGLIVSVRMDSGGGGSASSKSSEL